MEANLLDYLDPAHIAARATQIDFHITQPVEPIKNLLAPAFISHLVWENAPTHNRTDIQIDSFHLQYGIEPGTARFDQANVDAIIARNPDVLIAEVGPFSATTDIDGAVIPDRLNFEPFFDPGVYSTLENANIPVIAYMNFLVFDPNRFYWNDDFVRNVNDGDQKVDWRNIEDAFVEDAPAYLRSSEIISFENGSGQTRSRSVDLSDADAVEEWREVLIDLGTALISQGFEGLFLDDILRYFEVKTDPDETEAEKAARVEKTKFQASVLIELITDLAEAIRHINPNAYIILNGGVFLPGDATLFDDNNAPTNLEAVNAFYDAIDAVLMESLFLEADADGVMDAAIYNYDTASGGRIDLLASSGGQTRYQNYLADIALSRDAYDGIALFHSDSLAYLGAAEDSQILSEDTISADRIVLGIGTSDRMMGLSGSEAIYGLGGHDHLFGEDGDDSLFGGVGNDFLIGGEGQDQLTGGADRDVFVHDTDQTIGSFDQIMDFTPGTDQIQFVGDSFMDMETLLTFLRQESGYVAFQPDTGPELRLLNIDLTDLSLNDFRIIGPDGIGPFRDPSGVFRIGDTKPGASETTSGDTKPEPAATVDANLDETSYPSEWTFIDELIPDLWA